MITADTDMHTDINLIINRLIALSLQNNPLLSQDGLIFVSTLDGTLYAVNKITGHVQWSLKEGKL